MGQEWKEEGEEGDVVESGLFRALQARERGGEGFFSCTHDVKGKAKGRRGAFPSLRPSPFSPPISLHERPTSKLAEVCLSVDGEGSEEEWEDVVVSFLFSPLWLVPQKSLFFTSFTAAHLRTYPFSHFPPFRLLSVSSTFPPPSSLPSPPSRCMGIMRRQASPFSSFLWRPLLFPRSCQKGKGRRRLFFRARHPSSPLLEPREVVSAEKGGGVLEWWWELSRTCVVLLCVALV